ncbi:Protein FAR-RED ELONGATED HYPOCOTYL 3 [Bienertia sinuspersici]
MKIVERNYEPPKEWMEWEKQMYAQYDENICMILGVVQTLLMKARPSVALGTLALVTLSVPTSVILLALQFAKGVVEVEVDAMVVELEDSSRILDLEAPVEDVLLLEERGEGGFYDEGGVGVDADVIGDVGCTPTKECSDVVALAPPTVGMVFILGKRNAQWTCYRFGKPDRRRKVNGKRCVTNSQIKEDSGVKTSKKCECPVQIYASVNAENENEWVVRKRKLKLGHSAGLKVAQIHNKLARERNGLQEMAINERDIRNELYREKKLKLKDGDAKAIRMKTTQRIESIHSFFDEYVNKHTTLAEFAEMYCRAMEKRAEIERQYDAHNLAVWCRNKETKKEYLTQDKRNYRVCFDMSTKLAECEFSLFNHFGIICCHMIKLYDILGEEVPHRYILRRWRKDVSRKHTRVKVAYHNPSKTEHVVSYDEMQLAFEPICSKASVFKDTKHLILEFLELLDIRVDEKRVMIESEMLNQTLSSVCLKDKLVGTPASTTTKRKADCGIPTPDSCKPPQSAGNEGNVKDPAREAKPAHRTTDHQYYLAVEKAIKAKPKRKTKATISKGTSHLIDVNQGAIVLHPAHSMMVRHNLAPTMNMFQMCLVDTHTQLCRCQPATEDGQHNISVPMVDPDGSVGLFNHAGLTKRVLFPDNQASTNGSNSYPVDTYLKL